MKLEKIKNSQNILFLLLTLIVAGVYAGFLYNQTMPFAEGWYTYYAQCINEKGLVPYRDFEFLYSPIYIYFIAAVTKVFGYSLIVLRAMGILMFCTIALGIYLSIQLIVGKRKSWIACVAAVTAVFYMQSEVVQIFYDYVRLMDIISVYTVFFLIKTIKRMYNGEKYTGYMFVTGICCAFLINIKQNVGFIFAAYVLVLLVYLGLYYKQEIRRIVLNIIIFLFPIVIITILLYLVLAISGGLSDYLYATGAGAISAKGGMFQILFKWIPNNWGAFVNAFPAARNLFLLLVGVFGINFYLERQYGKAEESKMPEVYLGVLFALITVVLLFAICKSESFARAIFSANYLSPYTVFLLGFPVFVILGVWGFVNIIRKKRQIDEYVLIFTLAGAYFAIAYSCGNSGGLAEGQMTIGIALLVTLFLQVFSYKWERFLRIAVVMVCIGITIQTADKKMIYTYNWWGMDESDFWSSRQESEIPLLEGIHMSYETLNVYESVYDIIMQNTTDADAIYCFPQIPIFYSMTGREDPGTRSKVQWFDVSTDETVIGDIAVLQDNIPKVVIMYNTSEYAYQSHESAFRKGEMSGTRRMREFLYNFVYENHYSFGGRFVANNNVIQVWIREDESVSPINVFSGGNGTYEDPYLIESAEQLVTFSRMVNEGRTFENNYIRQIADIDLGEIDNWQPIGKFGGDTAFLGIYDGAGHVIKNLKVEETEEDYNLGLFGQLGGKVYNLGLEGGEITGSCCGVIASHTFGGNAAIINCYSDVDVIAYRAGGIADNFCGVIRNCFSVGDLKGIITANIVSYCANGACDVDNVYVVRDSIDCPVYDAALYDYRIAYCTENYINSDASIAMLNEYVFYTNKIAEEKQYENYIELSNWKAGNLGHPIFSTE